MTEITIPKAVKEILDVYIKFEFRALTYKAISNILNKESNTVIQRIKRNQEYFHIQGPKPHKITIKKGIEEVYFRRDKNQCQICRKTFTPKSLTIRCKDPNRKDKYDWKNVITTCKNCKDKEILKKSKAKKNKVSAHQDITIWEYHEIYIKQVEDHIDNIYDHDDDEYYDDEYYEENYDDYEDVIIEYFEFDELDGQGYFHLTDDDGKIDSWKVADILNFFGNRGWELIKIVDYTDDSNYEELDNDRIICHCFFKRKKVEDNGNGK